MQKRSLGGAHYLSEGFSLILKPGIRVYVIVPLLINLILLGFATIYAFSSLSDWYQSLLSSDSSWLQWFVSTFEWLLWPLIIVSVLIVVFFLFAFLANWIAAPFNGLLAEAVENHLLGERTQSQPFKPTAFLGDIPRLMTREWRKLAYYIPRALACLILFMTPLAFIAPFIWFFFNAWMAAIQYIDYPMDNHRIGFTRMLAQIRQQRGTSLGFGALVMLFTLIPLVNILVMPVAVAGATALWFDHYREGESSIE